MPSPFPGMDPYLESQGYWQDFHTSILVDCRKALKGVLPRHYAALIEERITLVDLSAEELRIYQPDVAIAREDRGPIAAGSRGVLLTLEPVTIPLIIEAVDKIRLTMDRDPQSSRPLSRHRDRDPVADKQIRLGT